MPETAPSRPRTNLSKIRSSWSGSIPLPLSRTLIRAVVGLFRYTKKYLAAKKAAERPRLVIAHDVRHFSRHFCELAASTWVRLGGEAFIFDGPRSTPQLSFSVRWLKAHAGVVITASHNPPHDNGFKAYFDDGAQVVAPHDKGIVTEVNAVPLADLRASLDQLDRGRPIVLMCAGGTRSAIASSVLLAGGFTDVSDVLGGASAVTGAVAACSRTA